MSVYQTLLLICAAISFVMAGACSAAAYFADITQVRGYYRRFLWLALSFFVAAGICIQLARTA